MARPPAPDQPAPDQAAPGLPARVRVSRLPLPPAQNVQVQLRTLFPALALSGLSAAAVALAGGRVVGAALRWSGQEEAQLALDSSWRGKGLEAALAATLAQPEPEPQR